MCSGISGVRYAKVKGLATLQMRKIYKWFLERNPYRCLCAVSKVFVLCTFCAIWCVHGECCSLYWVTQHTARVVCEVIFCSRIDSAVTFLKEKREPLDVHYDHFVYILYSRMSNMHKDWKLIVGWTTNYCFIWTQQNFRLCENFIIIMKLSENILLTSSPACFLPQYCASNTCKKICVGKCVSPTNVSGMLWK